MKKIEQIENIEITIDDSYLEKENINEILTECGKLANTVITKVKEEK